jgi:toxin ParE1/3/4
MSRCDFTSAASQDLRDIRARVAADSPDRAKQFVKRLKAACHRLANVPGIGTAEPDLEPALRRIVVAPYLIFYLPTEHGVEIVRVIHGARDIPRAFRLPPGP